MPGIHSVWPVFNAQSRSIKHTCKKGKTWMGLSYYLSLACQILLPDGDCVLLLTLASSLLLFQPGWEERVHSDGRTFYIDHSKAAPFFGIFAASMVVFCHICLRVSHPSLSSTYWLQCRHRFFSVSESKTHHPLQTCV